jgi:hypothetical protein
MTLRKRKQGKLIKTTTAKRDNQEDGNPGIPSVALTRPMAKNKMANTRVIFVFEANGPFNAEGGSGDEWPRRKAAPFRHFPRTVSGAEACRGQTTLMSERVKSIDEEIRELEKKSRELESQLGRRPSRPGGCAPALSAPCLSLYSLTHPSFVYRDRSVAYRRGNDDRQVTHRAFLSLFAVCTDHRSISLSCLSRAAKRPGQRPTDRAPVRDHPEADQFAWWIEYVLTCV